MDLMEDLPAPDRPIKRTLRCFWRLLRSAVLISANLSARLEPIEVFTSSLRAEVKVQVAS